MCNHFEEKSKFMHLKKKIDSTIIEMVVEWNSINNEKDITHNAIASAIIAKSCMSLMRV